MILDSATAEKDFRGKKFYGNTLPTTLPLGMMCDDLV